MKKTLLLLSLSMTINVPVASIATEKKEPEYYPIGRYTKVSFDIKGPVMPGETLWHIARSILVGENTTIDQMMIGLFKHNPGAFDQNNINCLKEGALLMVVGANAFQTLSQSEAGNVVKQHHQQWQQMKRGCNQ